MSEDFSLLVAFLLVTFSWLFRGFFVALFCLEKQCLGLFCRVRAQHTLRASIMLTLAWLFRGFFVVFLWLFRGPRFGQNLRILALEQSSENGPFGSANRVVATPDIGHFLRGGTLTRGNDIRVTPGMTVR